MGNLPYRSQCTCPCHVMGGLHMTACCQPDPRMTPTNDAPVTVEQCEAFWERVDRRGDDECWAWLGARGSTDNAYGRIHIGGRTRPASQVSWEIANSIPFPSGKVACHRCDNPICVNPAHIWPGTQSDNIRDCSEKGRLHRSIKTTCKRGHQLTEENRKAIRNGSRCLTCQRAANRRWKQRSTAKAKGAAA